MSKINQTDYQEYLELINQGNSQRTCCTILGLNRSTMQNYLKRVAEDEDSESIEVKHMTRGELLGASKVEKQQPRIVFWDLESSLMQGLHFGLWQQNISMRRVTKQTHLLSASFAFNDEEVQGFRLTPEQVKTGDDFDLVCKVVEAVNNCDLMVTFNGKKFDVKLLNTRAIFWGLPPVKTPKHIDLFEQSKRVFKFPSNSMQNVSMYLGLEGKLATSGSSLWERCFEWWNRDECEEALIEMVTYGDQDIVATRDLYKRFQGWMKGVPNLGTMTNEITLNKTIRCIHCGSDDIFPMGDKAYTAVSSFDLYRCANIGCRGVSRITKNGKHLTSVI